MTEIVQERDRSIPEPLPATATRLWLIVVTAFVIVLLGSFGSLVVLLFQKEPRTPLVSPEIILSIFSSVVGFLAGLFVPSPGEKR